MDVWRNIVASSQKKKGDRQRETESELPRDSIKPNLTLASSTYPFLLLLPSPSPLYPSPSPLPPPTLLSSKPSGQIWGNLRATSRDDQLHLRVRLHLQLWSARLRHGRPNPPLLLPHEGEELPQTTADLRARHATLRQAEKGRRRERQ